MSEGRAAPETGRRLRRAGLFGAAVGLAAAGVAIGVVAERVMIRRTQHESTDPYAEEPFGRLSYDESVTLSTPDGLDIYAEIVEAVDGIELDADFAAAVATDSPAPEPTVVFVHGFCLGMGTFHFQRKELTRRGIWRAVYYDQPGHGRSGRLSTGEYELPALGDALKAVLDETTPEDPIILVGHSMGGMTIMAFAERYPELYAQRVVGTVLIATSAGRLEAGSSGLPELISRAGRPLLPLLNGATKLTGRVIDRARQASGDLAWLLTRRYGFGGPSPSRALVSYVEKMNSDTPTETVARYLRTLYSHAGYPALDALRDKPVLLICGDCDPITPLAHSEEMKEHLPHADLVVIPDSGHVVLLEHADEVNEALLRFLEKID
jgi:pimeloyl-ACP methyl ester carboxylesterase